MTPSTPSPSESTAEARSTPDIAAQPDGAAMPASAPHPHTEGHPGGAPSASAPAAFHQPAAGHVVSPRNPALYALASFLLPGLGSLLAGAAMAGIVFFAVALGCGVLTSLLALIPVVGWFLALLVIPVWLGNNIWSMVHAYKTAQRWNARHGIVS